MRKRLPLFTAFLAVLLLAACHRSAVPASGPAATPQSPQSSSQAAGPVPSVAPGLPPTPSAAPPPSASAGPPPSASPAPPPPAVAAPTDAAKPSNPTIVLPPTQAQPGAPQVRSLGSAASLMAVGRGQGGILPEDFKIGPVGVGTGRTERDAAIAVATGFLSRLVAGSIDRQSMTAEAQESLPDTLSYGLQQGYAPTSFRLGAPKEGTNGEVAANVRFFDSDSSSEGEIYLSRAADHWLVADMQVNLADLAVPRAAPKKRYFPSPYRWLLEE